MTTHRESVSPTGLCSTCAAAVGCMHLRAAVAPVWSCEEFDDRVPPASLFDASTLALDEPNGSRIPGPASPARSLRGICSTCADAATCRLPKAEGGVWWCEEYR